MTSRGMWRAGNKSRKISIQHDTRRERRATSKSPQTEAGGENMTRGEGGGLVCGGWRWRLLRGTGKEKSLELRNTRGQSLKECEFHEDFMNTSWRFEVFFWATHCNILWQTSSHVNFERAFEWRRHRISIFLPSLFHTIACDHPCLPFRIYSCLQQGFVRASTGTLDPRWVASPVRM